MEDLILGAYICLQVKGTLEEAGELLSDSIFGGLPFGGLDKCIHEEIPAIYIKDSLMGMQVVLDGEAGEYHLSFDYSPMVTEDMDTPAIEQCAFFGRGFEDYMKRIIAKLPGVMVVESD